MYNLFINCIIITTIVMRFKTVSEYIYSIGAQNLKIIRNFYASKISQNFGCSGGSSTALANSFPRAADYRSVNKISPN
jgi:hypothetical protein